MFRIRRVEADRGFPSRSKISIIPRPNSGGDMLTLYHGRTSVCSIKARLALAEKAVDWDGRLLTLRGDQFDPDYMKLNPNAVIAAASRGWTIRSTGLRRMRHRRRRRTKPARSVDSAQRATRAAAGPCRWSDHRPTSGRPECRE